MKKSAYRSIFHVYLLFGLVFFAALIAAVALLFSAITVQKPDGSHVRSDWPKQLTREFAEQIYFVDGTPRIKQSGLAQLQAEQIGLQVLDADGTERFSYQKPVAVPTNLTSAELLVLLQDSSFEETDSSIFFGTIHDDQRDYVYVLFFPVHVMKNTMLLNADGFSSGKGIVLSVILIVLLGVLLAGSIYGICTGRAVKGLMLSVEEIAARRYLPAKNSGVYADLYGSLNTLDAEIRESDRQRLLTEKTRMEWIANITHDLKTPLSPIKGYAELLAESSVSAKDCRAYAQIILRNAAYMEALVDDLKLTYQFENNMLPLHPKEQDLACFLRTVIVDILNMPEYEGRRICLEAGDQPILFSFDELLLTRAFRNLFLNAFIHGNLDTAVNVTVSEKSKGLCMTVSDNGNGITVEQAAHLFDRYYRGTATTQKTEGTGLGLAIVKGIVEAHGGSISVSSGCNGGTTFIISLPTQLKVN